MTDRAETAQSPMGGQPATPDLNDVYRQHAGFVWNLLRRLGVVERDIEDTVHDVFVVVHRRLGDFDPRRPIRPWLAGIAVRVASDHRRRGYRRSEVVGQEVEAVEHRSDPEHALEEKQTRELVLEALDRLAPDQRTVVVLHELSGLPVPEIARIVEAPVNTCYSRLRLGRADLVKAIHRLRTRGVR